MMNNNPKITCYADLEREETRVRKRIKKHEEELHERLKKLPEEIVTIGVTKVITGIVSGNWKRTIVSIFKGVFSYFFGKKERSSNDGTLKKIFSDVFENFTNRGEEK